MNVRFDESLNRDGIERAIDCIEAAIRNEFPHIRSIYLEAESIAANSRLSQPEYPVLSDFPPWAR
jgi:hypothetical protein